MKYEDLTPEMQQKIAEVTKSNTLRLSPQELETISGGNLAALTPAEMWKIHAPMRLASEMEAAGGVCPICNQKFDISKVSDVFNACYNHVFDCLQKN